MLTAARFACLLDLRFGIGRECHLPNKWLTSDILDEDVLLDA